MNKQELIDVLAFVRAMPEGGPETNVLPSGSESPVTSIEVVTVLAVIGNRIDADLTSPQTLEECGDIKSFAELTALVDRLLKAD